MDDRFRSSTVDDDVDGDAALRASEARYRALATATADVIYRMSADWSEMRQLDGRGFLSSTDDPSGSWLTRYIHPDDQPRVVAAIDDAIRRRGTFELEHRVIRADGTLGWTLSRAVPLFGADGAIAEWIGTASDVTARRESDEALRASEARFRAVQDAAPYGFAIHRPIRDADGRVRDFANPYINEAGARIVGRSREEITRGTLLSIFPATAREGVFDDYVRVLESGEPSNRELLYEHDGIAAGFAITVVRIGSGDDAELGITFSDVTQRLRSERERAGLLAEVAAERERLRAVILQTPAPLALLEGPEHRFVLVNEAFKRVSGGGRDVTGLTPAQAFPELAGLGFHERFDQVYESGEPWIGPETPVRYDRDGTGVQDTWFDLRLEPVRDASGRVFAIFNFAVDVTEQVHARQAVERLLAESERARSEAEAAQQRSEAVLASIADAFYLLDREWRFTYVNDAAEPLLQTPRETLIGRTLWEAFPGVIGSPFEAPYREAMATGRVTSAEAYFGPLDTWFDVRTYPWSGGLMVHFRDIGTRMAAEAERERLVRALEIERSRLQEVFQRSPSFIVAFRGPEQVYEFVNEAYYQLVGHREILGKPLLEAVPEVEGQGYKEILDHVLQTGESWVGRESPVALQRTPGAPLETRYLDLVFQAFTEADGSRTGVIVHGSDVTEQVLARREVERLLGESERARADAESARRDAEEARAEAEHANRAKSEFLAVMSHELRTPLNAIGGYTELMEMGIRGPITDQQRQDFSRIQASQRHLLGLINEVLNYAKLETGAVQYALEDVPLRGALAAAESLVLPQVRARSLTLTTREVAADLAARADSEKLRQILVNLLSNAVKFTEPRDGKPGRIELACVAAGERVRISVTDTGIGIPADKLEAIFDPFVQVRGDLTRTAEGTGLGLAISRDLARGMGGDLTAESELGKGSTFTLELPRARL